MGFNYRDLKIAEENGYKIGMWKGKAVFSCSSDNLSEKGTGAYFVLYDDENTIVKKNNNGDWMAYGSVSTNGDVNEYSSGRRYTVVEAPTAAETTTASYTPGYDIEERPVGDVKCEIDVEATLKKAREMSIADLLEGFSVTV